MDGDKVGKKGGTGREMRKEDEGKGWMEEEKIRQRRKVRGREGKMERE